MKKSILFLLLIIISFTSFSQNENLKEISGTITFQGTPISDVNVTLKDTSIGTKTNKRGQYIINASVGDVLQFSHIAFKSVSIIVEDISKELNIEMITHTNELNEVVIIAKLIDGKVLKYTKKAEQEFSTSRGILDPKTAGFAVGYVDGADISNVYPNIQEALRGKVSGYTYDMVNNKGYLRGLGSSINQDYPVAWELDGVFTTEPPVALDLSQIVNIYVLKSLASTNKYGSQAVGGVIVINTKSGDFWKKTKIGKVSEHYTNKDFYNNDAIAFSNTNTRQNSFSITLESFSDKQFAYAYYNDELSKEINDYYNQIAIAKTFINFYKDSELGLKILTDLAKIYSDHPEILKALAYQIQAIGKTINAVKLYEDIFILRPNYAQSYRDLANAYLETDQFKKAWRLYMRYLLQGYDLSNTSIGEIMYNEMEYLYFLRKDRAEIKEQFVPKSEKLSDFRNDVRLVFEWNTSEAEFDLEFVNPNLRSYVFEHSLAYDEDLINDEKIKGYSSKEFIIDELGNGEWLVNLTYHGNKKSGPTYFKVTKYYNWGKPNQRQETNVLDLWPDQNRKLQLLKLDKNLLLGSK